MTLTKLHKMGSRWYATVVDGNMTSSAPTCYHSSLTQAQVLKDIRKRSPDMEIKLEKA
jgi:hypothetical protein